MYLLSAQIPPSPSRPLLSSDVFLQSPPTLPLQFSLSFMFFLNSHLLFHFILDMDLLHETIMFCIIQTFAPPAPFFSWFLVEGDVLYLDAQDCGLIRYRFQSVSFVYPYISARPP